MHEAFLETIGKVQEPQIWMLFGSFRGSLGVANNQVLSRQEHFITKFIFDAFGGLQQVHVAGVVHRDLEPATLLVYMDKRSHV